MKTLIAQDSALNHQSIAASPAGGIGSGINSGAGNDTYHVPGDVVSESPNGGIDLVIATVSYTLGDNVENLTLDGTGNIDGTGNGLNNLITGNSGSNVLIGGAGNDTLIGGGGNDNMFGGAGDDVFYFDYSDAITELPGEGNDTVMIDGSISVAGSNIENVGLLGSGDYTAQGDDGANRLTGNAGNNILNGIGGADHLIGNAGNDTLNGGAGNDTLEDNDGSNEMHGGDGDDVLIYNTFAYNNTLDGGNDNDTLELSPFNTPGVVVNLTDGTMTDGFGSDVLVSIENINGGGGSDVFTGSDAANLLNGGVGDDSLYAGGGNDTVHGGDGGDVIYGGNGINALYGDDGNDYIQTQTDIYYSTYDGGSGRDTIDYSWLFGDYNAVIDLTLGSYVDSFGNETILNFENVLGTQGSETILGTGDANSLYGYDGNDSLSGLGGDDNLSGGNGNDTINAGGFDVDGDTVDGGDGDDLITSSGRGTYLGGLGNDTIAAGVGTRETLNGGDGTDQLDLSSWSGDYIINLTTGATNYVPESFINFENVVTGLGSDTVTGTGGANQIWTGAGNDSVSAGGGNDWIDGGSDIDTLAGGLGDDTFIVDNAADVVTESNGQGTDTILSSVTYALGATYIEVLALTGDASIDAKGNTINNALNGNAGSNRLDGGAGADTLTGGLGNDTYVVDNAGDIVVELAGQGTDTLQTIFTAVLTTIENLILTGTAAVNGTGNGLDNNLTGNSGNNTLTGLDGNDRLDGGGGTDGMVGGRGNDTYIVDNVGDGVTELNNQGTDTVMSSVSFALTNGQSIETLILTGPQHINASGNASANILVGNSGNNILNGGSGADSMAGGAGHDIYVVENTGDTVTEGLNAGTDTVQSAVSFVLGDNIENLTLAGSANIDGTGNALANTIYGNAGANVLNGMGGIDKLYGRGGNDTYIIDNAGVGVSELLGGVDAGGNDTVYASVTYGLGLYIENLILTGSGNINGVGNGLANAIAGNNGNNYLTGGGGNDIMAGLLGADVFVFGANSGVDIVTDFSALQNDRINVHALSNGVVGGAGITLSQVGGDTVVNLGGGNMVTIFGVLLADVQSHMVW